MKITFIREGEQGYSVRCDRGDGSTVTTRLELQRLLWKGGHTWGDDAPRPSS